MARNRDRLCEMLDDGTLDPVQLARDLLNWLSNDDCAEFAHANDIELFEETEDEPEESEDDDD